MEVAEDALPSRADDIPWAAISTTSNTGSSLGGTSMRMTPPSLGEASSTDTQICSVIAPTEGASAAPSSVCFAADAPVCAGNNSSCAASASSAAAALDSPSPAGPTIDMAAYADGTVGCAAPSGGVTAALGHTASVIVTGGTSSAFRSPTDAAFDCAVLADAVAVPALLPLDSNAAPADPRPADRSARVFLGASLRGAPRPPTL